MLALCSLLANPPTLTPLPLRLFHPSPPAASIPAASIDAYMVVLQEEGLLAPTAQDDCFQVGGLR